MAECPHCKEPIESLSGFVPQAKLEERIAAKNGEIKQLSDKLAEVVPKAGKYEALEGELAEWRGKYEQVTKRIERTAVLASKGVNGDLLDSIEVLYESAQAGAADGERKDFGAWLEADAPAHPLLAAHFAQPVDGAQPEAGKPEPEVEAPATPPAPAGLPSTPGAAQAPKQQGKMSRTQVREYFRSAEYRALKPEEQRAEYARVMGGT